jgi:hypothetical protein
VNDARLPSALSERTRWRRNGSVTGSPLLVATSLCIAAASLGITLLRLPGTPATRSTQAVEAPATSSAVAAPSHRSAPALSGPSELDARFAAEAVDDGWARTTSTALSESIKDMALKGARVTSIECRSQACKIGFHFDSARDARGLLDNACVGPQAKWFSLRLACLLLPGQTTADGSGDGWLFAFRDGKLPQML